MIVLLLAALLGIAATMIVLHPLLGLDGHTEGGSTSGTGDLAERERAAKGALREVEFDYRLGNLEAADYQALRDRYEARALSAIQARYTCERELDALIDRELAAVRAAGASGTQQALQRGKSPSAINARRTPRRRRGGGGSRG